MQAKSAHLSHLFLILEVVIMATTSTKKKHKGKTSARGTDVSAPRDGKSGELIDFPSYCSMPIVPAKVRSSTMHPGRLALIVMLEKKWVNGTTLHYYFFDKETDGRTVQFTDGSTERRKWTTTKAEKEVVRKAFDMWKRVGLGITFVEVNRREDAEIRIGFERDDGAWSFVGRDLIDLGLGVNERTMNFGWDLTAHPSELDTAIHEIGHTLGFPHEHQNPIAGIEWDEEAVFAALALPPNSWSRETTFHNIIRKITPDSVQGSEWDPNSVMHYPFGPGLIRKPERFSVTGISPAGGLSARDKSWVRSFYPPLSDQPAGTLQPAQSLKLDLLPGGQKNFLIEPVVTRRYQIQTFGPSDTVKVLFEKDGEDLRYILGEDDSGLDTNGVLEVKLLSGRKYVLRVRLSHAERPEETAIMLW